MLRNLVVEYTKKNIKPYIGIMNALGCTEKTARNKIAEVHPVTVPEALKIRATDFANDNFSIEYLFATDEEKTA